MHASIFSNGRQCRNVLQQIYCYQLRSAQEIVINDLRNYEPLQYQRQTSSIGKLTQWQRIRAHNISV